MTIPELPGNPHPAHCCAQHGCKYGDRDCPVRAGSMRQEFPCEECDKDPRTGVSIPAGVGIADAAVLVLSWLYENTNSPQQRAQFVIELDELTADYDFTLACVKGLAGGLPDTASISVASASDWTKPKDQP